MRRLTYVEIDVDMCSLTYGVAPCEATLAGPDPTGTRKCFNSLKTCQDPLHFTQQTRTLRFVMPASYLPVDPPAIPSIRTIGFNPAVISLGENLGQRATFTVTFDDHPHSDVGFMHDKYLADRPYNPYKQGTFWGKFRARFPFVQGRALRVYRGELGQALADMDVRHYVIESFDGPFPDGSFTMTAKDVLKLADNDRAQAPPLSEGFLVAAINNVVTSCTLSPSNVSKLYPLTGWAAIGGSEIVRYQQVLAGDRDDTVLLLHFEGSDGATTTTDSSPNAHAVTFAGNAQIDNSQTKIGSTTLQLDGTGDYIRLDGSDDFALGTGDFAIGCWVRRTSTAVQTIFDFTPSGGGDGNYLKCRINPSAIVLSINGADILTSAASLTINVWHHIFVQRIENQISLYLNGAGVVSADNGTSLDVGAQRPIIGADGTNVANENFAGNIDEFFIFDAGILNTVTVTPFNTAFGASSDVVAIVRGQFNTAGSAHDEEDRFQLCRRYSGRDPSDIIYDLFVNYADIPPEYIDLNAWRTETSTFLQRLYTGIIAEPTGVNLLVSELVEQAALAVWWDDSEQRIQLRVLREIGQDANTIDENFVIDGSVSSSEQPAKRLSQVWTYFSLINPLDGVDDPSNYRSTALTVEAQLQSDYGSPAVKRIYSRWIPQFGRSTALRLNDLLLGRYKDAPRKISFETFGPLSTDLRLGFGYNFEYHTLQDDTGARATVPLQITRLNPDTTRFQIEAEEALFLPFDEGSLTNRVIIIDTDTIDFNLRTVHDTIYPEITDGTGITVTLVIEEGVKVGTARKAASTLSGGRYLHGGIAVDIGTWISAPTFIVQLRGDILAGGGKGGNSNTSVFTIDNKPGQNGAIAFKTTYAVTIDCKATAKIYGGGGGGAGGFQAGTPNSNSGGGGGAGYLAGLKGTANSGGYQGNDGNLNSGGNGGSGGLNIGGDGGDPGTVGQTKNGALGGLGGNAIVGNAFITYSDETPDIVGPVT